MMYLTLYLELHFPVYFPVSLEFYCFFSITGQGIDLDYCNIEWLALEMNRDHSVFFEVASEYCIFGLFC